MRSLAIAAVALVPLLGGCVAAPCDVPTATIAWSLQDPGGTSWSCGAAGVTMVDVYIGNTTRPTTFPCAAYGGVIDVSGLAVGTYPATVEGLDANGNIIDRAQFDLPVLSCGGTAHYPVLAEGMLEIDYHFAPVDACHGGSMWFALRDDTTGQDIFRVDANTPASRLDDYPCYSTVSGVPLRFAVPFGHYTLRGIQEVIDPLVAPVSIYEACTPAGVSVHSAGTTLFTPPLLTATLPGSPACF
jgi:hypothetical protein